MNPSYIQDECYIHTRSLKKYLVKYENKLHLIPIYYYKEDIPIIIKKFDPVDVINDYIVEFIDLDELK